MSSYIFTSSDKKTTIHCRSYEPSSEPKAVLLIVHGMCEYIERYEDFAKYLTGYGIYVAGHDHIGHGHSINTEDDWGFFGKDGNKHLLKDIDTHVDLLREKFPNLPLVIMGHSMGSFLTRQYLSRKSEKLNAAIIMGTGTQPNALLMFGRSLAGVLSKTKGDHYRSNLIQQIGFGGFLKRIENPETSMDWLTHDREIIDSYTTDPACDFKFTVNGFAEMFKSMLLSQDVNRIKNIRKDLPMFFVAGDEDPVGQYGDGVKKAMDLYKKAGIQNIKCKLYKNMRHEILNEVDRAVPYQDIKDYILEL